MSPPDQSAAAPASENAHALPRRIGLWSMVAITMGVMIEIGRAHV